MRQTSPTLQPCYRWFSACRHGIWRSRKEWDFTEIRSCFRRPYTVLRLECIFWTNRRSCEPAHIARLGPGLSVLLRLPRGLDGNATMKKLIAVALILCAAIV